MSNYRNVLLINEKNIKDFSLLDDNLSYDYIVPILKFVQDEKMTRILGKYLYDDIRQQILTGSTSDDYKILLDNYIKYVLTWGVLNEIQVPLNIKFRNAGMVESNTDFGANTLLDNIKYTKNSYERISNFYETQLINFLIDNSNTYPLWNWCNGEYACYNKSVMNNYNCSIYLGK